MIHFQIQEAVVPENIFFVHGNLCSARFWEPTFRALQSRYPEKGQGSLMAVDYPGCGKSAPPETQSEIQIELLAERFLQVIDDNGFGPCHLVGHSAGGLIAAVMLAKRPNLFKRTVLLDPVGAKGVVFNNVMLPAFEAMKVDKALTGTIIGSTIYNNDAESDFFKNVVVEDAFSAVKNVGSWILQALDGVDFTALVKKIEKPVLVLHGEHDSLLPMKDSEELASMISSASFEVICGQGHCCNVENPEWFANKVIDFIAQ